VQSENTHETSQKKALSQYLQFVEHENEPHSLGAGGAQLASLTFNVPFIASEPMKPVVDDFQYVAPGSIETEPKMVALPHTTTCAPLRTVSEPEYVPVPLMHSVVPDAMTRDGWLLKPFRTTVVVQVGGVV
jgi:hypothetical protein